MIYLDNAATSHPKPASVVEAVTRCLTEVGGNPGRSAHRMSAAGARVVFDARERLAELFAIRDSRNLLLTSGATFGLNTVLFGLLRENDHVITTSMEHNSVARPLSRLVEKRGVRVTVVQADAFGRVTAEAAARAVRPDTKLAVVCHGSNVNGAVQPVGALKQAIGKTLLLVDAAQTAGAYPIDVDRYGIDFLAFSGHKCLRGPQGTGGLFIRPGLEVEPLVFGGTGSKSPEDTQPEFLPDKFESGTPNMPGIAGLGAGAEFILQTGIPRIHEAETEMLCEFVEMLARIPGLRLVGEWDDGPRLPTVCFNLRNMAASETSRRLDKDFGIMTRPGLHCSPYAHKTLGTFPDGAVRISFNFQNGKDELRTAAEALREISKQ